MKKLKDIFHNYWLTGILCVFFAAWAWTKSLHISQTYMVNNPYWYNLKSKMITSNMMGSTGSALSRSNIAGNQLNLRAGYGANEINSVQAVQLSSLSFDASIPLNSYLDVIFNVTDQNLTAFRLSRSSLFSSMSYHGKREGDFITAQAFHIDLPSSGKVQVKVQESEEGITLFVDGQKAAVIPNDHFQWAQFGFKTGMRGAFVSNIEALDVSGIKIGTSLENNRGYEKHFIGHFFIILAGALIIAFVVKKLRDIHYSKSFALCTSFIFLLGGLWLAFDYLYFSRLESDWSDKKVATRRIRGMSVAEEDYDFEVGRYRVFKAWYEAWGGKSSDIHSFIARFGESKFEPSYFYCFNEKCGSIKERGAIKAPDNGRPTIKIGLVGASFSYSSGVTHPGDGFMNVAHKRIYESVKDRFNLESINFSIDQFSYRADRKRILKKVQEEKINYLLLTKNTDFSVIPEQDRGFKKLLKEVTPMGVTPIYLSLQKNPESFMRTNSEVKLDLLFFNKAMEEQTSLKEKEMTDRWAREFGLIVLNPNPYLNRDDHIKNGNMWWDRAHLTSYGYRLYGEWLGDEMTKILAQHN